MIKAPFLIFLSAFLFLGNSFTNEQPYIEVNGYADIEIVPDEIYIAITLKERIENREKITIDTLEEQLRNAFKVIQVPIENLSLADLNSHFNRINKRKSDVFGQVDYLLKCSSASMVFEVFQELDKINVHRASIKYTNHSMMDSLRREVRTKAIKNAKEKADYLLDAIGEKTGKALVVKENSININQQDFHGFKNASTAYFVDGVRVVGSANGKEQEKQIPIEFKKIKLTFTVYVKFSIE